MFLTNWIKGLALKKAVGSVVRHTLTTLSGALLMIGVTPEQAGSFASSAEPVAMAVILYLGGLIWSFVEKKKK